MSEIKVNVVDYGRKYLYMRYTDPNSGKLIARSTGTASKKEAVKVAAKWEAELQEGRYKSPSKVTWKEFRERYENEVLSSLSDNTDLKAAGVFNAVEELIGVDKLVKLDASQISRFQKLLRDEKKLAETTIKGHLSHLKAALNWAGRVGLLSVVPTIELPKRAKGNKVMKGRPITSEEFERMLSKTFDIVENVKPLPDDATDEQKSERERLKAAKQSDVTSATYRYRWLLRALWWGGLRLGEALDLSWDESGHIEVDLSEEFPMLIIPGDKQKSGNDELLPIAPEFAEMLLSVPRASRTGKVFKLGRRAPGTNPKLLYVSKTISKIGERAGVVVNPNPKKFASAHDLRRAFGLRWSERVMPAVLQQMMRHESIETTMKFYVGQDGQKAAATIYAAYSAQKTAAADLGNTCGNTSPIEPETTKADSL